MVSFQSTWQSLLTTRICLLIQLCSTNITPSLMGLSIWVGSPGDYTLTQKLRFKGASIVTLHSYSNIRLGPYYSRTPISLSLTVQSVYQHYQHWHPLNVILRGPTNKHHSNNKEQTKTSLPAIGDSLHLTWSSTSPHTNDALISSPCTSTALNDKFRKMVMCNIERSAHFTNVLKSITGCSVNTPATLR